MSPTCTIVITATLVMQLVDESLLRLDDTIRTVLSEFRTADADISGQISVRHLLTHTGGLEGDLWATTTSGADALQRFVEDLVTQAPQNIAPGERFSYCNAGYGVLGRIVEVLRESTYEDAVRRYLAEPLGIDELVFSADEALAFRTARAGIIASTQRHEVRPLSGDTLMMIDGTGTSIGSVEFSAETTTIVDGFASLAGEQSHVSTEPSRTPVHPPADSR